MKLHPSPIELKGRDDALIGDKQKLEDIYALTTLAVLFVLNGLLALALFT